MTARLHVGTAGWSYPDWKGVVYPRRVPESFDALRYLAAYLDTIEINSTFYRAPEPQHAERWAAAVSDLARFQFTAKLPREFSHQPPEDWSNPAVIRFQEGVRPLIEAGKLSALLIQFPFYFDARPLRLEHLRRLAGTFEPVPLVLEARHRSFLDPLDGGVGTVVLQYRPATLRHLHRARCPIHWSDRLLSDARSQQCGVVQEGRWSG